ncbi:MAG TPA: FecR domain-containing protein [Bacteroidia bacterium]|nr:FecR domain-containing protein [Bacteroidia bacterium]
MIDLNNIDDLISKFLSGEAEPQEALWLEDWKSENPANLSYFNHCKNIFETVNGYKQTDQAIDTTAAWEKIKPMLSSAKKETPVRQLFYLRVAASIALLIGIGSVFYFVLNKPAAETNYYAAGNQSQAIQLTDGTCIIMAPHSTLSLDNGFGKNNRLLHLNGSAYFSVVHNEALPLIVDAGKVLIKDIGTQYNVVTSRDSLYVHVDEGEVELLDNAGSKLNVKALQSALYIKSQGQFIDNGKDTLINRQTKDTPRFNFVNAKLSDVVQRLNETYKTNIQLENKSIENCTLTTKFYDEDIKTILLIISETLGLKYETNKDGYIIRGERCIQ